MKYLFFDIECSNTFNGEGKICEFGYVITDTNFNILQRRNIVMSPGPKGMHDYSFDNSRARCDKGFERWFDPIEYYSCNEFPHYYQQIYDLLTDKDTLVFGFAVSNDIHYIDFTCYRYNLAKPKYFAIDIKYITDIYNKAHPDPRFKAGLDDCFKRYISVNEFIKIQAHKAVNDAYMTMMVMKALCNLYNKNVDELIALYPNSKLDSSKYEIDWSIKQEERRQEKLMREKCNEEWGYFLELYKDNSDSNKKKIFISSAFKKDISLLKEVFEFIKSHDYIPVKKLFKSDCLLVANENDKTRLVETFQIPYSGEIILFNKNK